MEKFDFSGVRIDKLITHFVGNKIRDENVITSNKMSEVKTETVDFLLKYFLSSFKSNSFYKFSHSVNLEMNEAYILLKNIFKNENNFISESINLAKILYEYSSHPKIKGGEFNVVLFKNLILNDEVLDGIGIFKSENHVPFIKMKEKDSNFTIEHEFGFDLKGVDKGCLIFNTNTETGYNVLAVDNINKSGDAQYWLNDFLKLVPSSNAYNNTKNFLDATKDFVTKKLSDEIGVSKTEKIDLLNKTMNYFKNNDSFNKNDFEESVLKNEKIIKTFREYNDLIQNENDIELSNSFKISSQAVKKQSRKFKKILKLDKNFHVYIHGNKDLIEKGVENDGRKYYKIYYDKEN